MNRTFVLLAVSNALASVGTGISMIALPWHIVTSANENKNLLYMLASIANLALFLIVPFMGPAIDQKNRKKLMIAIRLIFIIMIIASLYIPGSLFNISFTVLIYYFSGSLFYAVNIPTRSAFVKDLFKPSEYARVNSFLETENQISAVFVGIIAVMLVEKVEISALVMLNVIFYILAIWLISFIEYTHKNVNETNEGTSTSLLNGIKIATQKSHQFYLIAISSVPYVVVIGFTIFYPSAIATFESETSKTYALVETLFGAGAIISGILTSKLINIYSNEINLQKSLLLTFSIICCAHSIFVSSYAYIILAFFLGLLNSSIRIVNITFQMNMFSHSEMGRIGTLIQSWTLGLRALLLSCLAFLSGIMNIPMLASILSLIVFLAFIGLFFLPITLTKNNLKN